MDTRLPTYEDMMVLVKALIAVMRDELIKPDEPVQSYAKTQELIIMALAYLGERDIHTVISLAAIESLKIDPEEIRKGIAEAGEEKNIYKYFDDLYAPVYGRSSKAAFEQADKTITAAFSELVAMQRRLG